MAQAPRRIGATSAAPAIAAGSAARGKTTALRRRAEPLLGQRHDGDHALVGLSRRVAEGEDAVLQQHQPFDRGIGLEDLGRLLGEPKPGMM